MTLRFTWDSFSVVLDLDFVRLDTDGDLAFSFYIRVAVAGQMYILDKNTALAAVQVMVIPQLPGHLYTHIEFLTVQPTSISQAKQQSVNLKCSVAIVLVQPLYYLVTHTCRVVLTCMPIGLV